MRTAALRLGVALGGLALACAGEVRDGKAPAAPEPPREPAVTGSAPADPPAAPDPASKAPASAPGRPAAPSAAASASVAARAEGENWVVALEVPGQVPAGEGSRALVRILARGGMHVNEEYPTSFRPAPDATADLGGDRVALREAASRTPCSGEPASACEMTFPLSFRPKGAGEVRVAGTLAFSVCNAEICLIEKAPLSVVARAR